MDRPLRDVLPANVIPLHYDLKLWPDLIGRTFKGEELIQIQVKEPTSTIQINCNDVIISSASLQSPNGILNASSVNHEKEKEVTTLSFPQELLPGKYGLFLVFTGILNDKMAGFYISEYTAQNGEKRNMAVTQFEATDARRAFPCWDEPALKATFKITLVVPTDRVALSNMDIEKEVLSEDGKTKEVSYGISPIMSTYLVAFVVGEFEFVEDFSNGTRVRVYTPVGETEKGKTALAVGTKTLSFLSEYFDEKYPLPKLDLIAIPDFSAGAMENWGLVTFRTMYLLFDEKESSLKAKQNMAYIVAHELAHQWFGNLVTMEWWTDLWLNEGFATWVGWLVVDHLFPEWDIWTQFLINEQGTGFKLDGMRSSHPIEVDVKNPKEISQVFDAISYSKGACVIRMLVNYLGSEVFVKGLRAYLKKHKYGNASTKDLWESLSEASGESIVDLMTTWTRKVGFPVVSVEKSPNDPHEIKFAQKRFLSTGDAKPEEDDQIWRIPLAVTTNGNEAPIQLLLKERESKFRFEQPRKFLKVNTKQTGFYRVSYDASLLGELKTGLEEKGLQASDRVGLVSDSYALAYAGFSTTSQALSLVNAFKNETNFVVWDEISSFLANIRSIYFEQPEDVQEKLKTLTRSLFAPQAKRLGWTFPAAEDFNEASLRTLSISNAGRAGDPEIVAEAKQRFESFTQGNLDAIHPNIRGAVFSIVLIHGGQVELDKIMDIYRKTTLADQKVTALVSLCSTPDPALIQRVIDFAFTEEVRSQDLPFVLGAIAQNTKGRRLAWKTLVEKWPVILSRFSGGSFLLGRTVTQTCGSFASTEMVQEIEDFFGKRDKSEIASIDRDILQSIEKVRSNAMYLQRDSHQTFAWIRENILN